MMFGLSTEEFAGHYLPDIVRQHQRLQVLVTTYHDVDNYPAGDVRNLPEGLHIRVVSGGLIYPTRSKDLILQGMISHDLELADRGIDLMKITGEQAQNRVEQSVALDPLDESTSLLVLGYAGLSAFEQAVAFFKLLKEKYPKALIVLYSCDCDRFQKADHLLPLITNGVIATAVFTEICGGQRALGKAIDAIKEAWQGKLSTPIPS